MTQFPLVGFFKADKKIKPFGNQKQLTVFLSCFCEP
jgi:hypothetical protein